MLHVLSFSFSEIQKRSPKGQKSDSTYFQRIHRLIVKFVAEKHFFLLQCHHQKFDQEINDEVLNTALIISIEVLRMVFISSVLRIQVR